MGIIYSYRYIYTFCLHCLSAGIDNIDSPGYLWIFGVIEIGFITYDTFVGSVVKRIRLLEQKPTRLKDIKYYYIDCLHFVIP